MVNPNDCLRVCNVKMKIFLPWWKWDTFLRIYRLQPVASSNLNNFLGGLSLHLNHLIGSQLAISFRQFGTLPVDIFLSNLVSRQLETSPRAP